MNTPVLLIVVIALLIVGLLVVLFARYKKGEEISTDYRSLFIMGIIWLPAGIAIGNYGLSAMGLAFMIAGGLNKDKWKEPTKWADLPDSDRRMKMILIGVLTLLLFGGVAAFMLAGQ